MEAYAKFKASFDILMYYSYSREIHILDTKYPFCLKINT